MDRHCLSRLELSRFLEIEFKLDEVSDAQIEELVEDWENWRLEFICLATLLSQVLENKQKQSINVSEILRGVLTFSERKGLFSIEAMGEEFVEYMLKDVRIEESTIEDNLVQIRRNLSEFKY